MRRLRFTTRSRRRIRRRRFASGWISPSGVARRRLRSVAARPNRRNRRRARRRNVAPRRRNANARNSRRRFASGRADARGSSPSARRVRRRSPSDARWRRRKKNPREPRGICTPRRRRTRDATRCGGDCSRRTRDDGSTSTRFANARRGGPRRRGDANPGRRRRDRPSSPLRSRTPRRRRARPRRPPVARAPRINSRIRRRGIASAASPPSPIDTARCANARKNYGTGCTPRRAR